MTLALREFLASKEDLDERAVRKFVREHGSPIVEGDTITFLFHGDVDEVHLRHFIYSLPSTSAFERVAGTNLWFLRLEVPRGSRIEYKLEVAAGRQRRMIRDPLNDKLAHDPYGANSVCHASGYSTPSWTQPDPESRAGTMESFDLKSAALGGDRHIEVYLPARMRATRRYPLLIVFDGADYLHFAGMKTILDNLIHRHELEQMIVAFTQSPDRMKEYAADEAMSRFVAHELLPAMEGKYPLRPGRQFRGLMGASLGGVVSLSTAWRHPKKFGKLMLQSGSFAFTDIGRTAKHPVLLPVVDWMKEFREKPGHPAEKIFISCGVYEGLIYENRSLVPLLEKTGMEVRFTEARDGHNWENWRDRLREGLCWLFPGPLGLVYE
ncbi:MAG: enterochelin esterase [Planctomycetes bacterium]|nr:enterochelin esterase [Planctomycetota bacterium]